MAKTERVRITSKTPQPETGKRRLKIRGSKPKETESKIDKTVEWQPTITITEEKKINSKIEDKIFNDPILSGPTVDREYSKAPASSGDSTPIPEIEIIPPKIDDHSNSFYDELSGNTGKENEFEPTEESKLNDNATRVSPPPPQKERTVSGSTFMPGMEEADTKTKKEAAHYLADVCIGAYVFLHELGKGWVTIDEKKMEMQAVKGKFDMAVLNIELPMSEDRRNNITVKEFLDSINQSAEETFVVSEEFKERVRPLLIKIFMKKGWGMTPEQQLIAVVVEDAIPKVQQLILIKTYTKQVLDVAMSILKELQEANKKRPDSPITNAQPVHEENNNNSVTSEADFHVVNETVEVHD